MPGTKASFWGGFGAAVALSAQKSPQPPHPAARAPLLRAVGISMENEAPLWEVVLLLPSQRVRDWPGRRSGQSRQGWLGQPAPLPGLHCCVVQPALSADGRVPVLTAALTPLCFFGVQICQGRWWREHIKAFFFFFHFLES